MSLPNVIIIGAQKAGTTSMFDWIAQHPEVFGEPSMKDFPFFADDNYFNKGLGWFSAKFRQDRKVKVLLHGSVRYIYDSKYVAKRLYNYNKNLKMILMLRNPVDRAYSAFWYAKKANLEPLSSFGKAIEREQKLMSENIRVEPIQSYIGRSLYCKQILDYYNYFKKDQIKIIIFEQCMRNKEKCMNDVFNFLNIDKSFVPDFKKLNASGKQRIKHIDILWKNFLIKNYIKRLLPYRVRFRLKEMIKRLNTKKYIYPKLADKERRKLMNLFESDLANVSKLINKDLSEWL
jgi:hypothetical protein